MSPAIQKFLALEAKKADVKKYFEELDNATAAVVAEIGLNSYFQDPSSGCVFKMVKPEGVFTKYKDVGYVRTKKADEKRGELSVKEAEEAGFTVK